MNGNARASLERVMRENNIPVPDGRGREKLNEIKQVIRTHEMPADLRGRLQNLANCV